MTLAILFGASLLLEIPREATPSPEVRVEQGQSREPAASTDLEGKEKGSSSDPQQSDARTNGSRTDDVEGRQQEDTDTEPGKGSQRDAVVVDTNDEREAK